MSWGIQFRPAIFIRGFHPRSKEEVQDRIDESLGCIQSCKEKLKMFAAATPKDIIKKEDFQDVLDSIGFDVDQILHDMEEEYQKLHDLYLLRNYLEDNPEANFDDLNF